MPPVYGLYTSLIPQLLYFVFGTSHHLSVGTFSLVSLLIKSSSEQVLSSVFNLKSDEISTVPEAVRVQVVLLLTFFAGILQIVISFFRMGDFVSTYLLPGSLISGVTTAASIQILTSQFKYLFALDLPSVQIPGRLWATFVVWAEMFQSLNQANWLAFGMGISTLVGIISVRALNNWIAFRHANRIAEQEVVPAEPVEAVDEPSSSASLVSMQKDHNEISDHANEQPQRSTREKMNDRWAVLWSRLRKFRWNITLPDILIPVIILTLITFLLRLDQAPYSLKIVGDLPSGFPSPTNPFDERALCPDGYNTSAGNTTSGESDEIKFQCTINSVIVSSLFPSFLLAIIGYALSSAIVKLFAIEKNYLDDINLDQDLLALGICSVLGCVIGNSFIASGSLARTALQARTGGYTQLVSVFSAIGLIMVILWLGPLLSFIPYSVLAGVVIIAVSKVAQQLSHGFKLLSDTTGFCRLMRPIFDKMKEYFRLFTGVRRDESPIVDQSDVEPPNYASGFENTGQTTPYETLLWWTSFLMVLMLGLDIGLGIGMGLCAVFLFIDMGIPRWIELGKASAFRVDINMWAGNEYRCLNPQLSNSEKRNLMQREYNETGDVVLTPISDEENDEEITQSLNFFRPIGPGSLLHIRRFISWRDLPVQWIDIEGMDLGKMDSYCIPAVPIRQTSFPRRVLAKTRIYYYHSLPYPYSTKILQWNLKRLCGKLAEENANASHSLEDESRDDDSLIDTVIIDISDLCFRLKKVTDFLMELSNNCSPQLSSFKLIIVGKECSEHRCSDGELSNINYPLIFGTISDAIKHVVQSN